MRLRRGWWRENTVQRGSCQVSPPTRTSAPHGEADNDEQCLPPQVERSPPGLALITDWTAHIAVYKSAGTPFSHTVVVSSRAKTRGCQLMFTFYELTVGGNVSICPEWLAYGSGLGLGPKLGERVRVDGLAHPLGA
jgi:hypothetical protein